MDHRVEYQGDGFGLVDDKGRVAIPAALRNALAVNAPRADGKKDGGTVVIAVHQKNKCLIAYDPAYRTILKAQADAREANNTLDGGEFDYNIKRRVSHGEEVPFDGSGRCILPGFPRHFANIDKHAFFWGVFDYFEIWDPRTLADADGLPDVMKSAVDYHCKQKGIAL